MKSAAFSGEHDFDASAAAERRAGDRHRATVPFGAVVVAVGTAVAAAQPDDGNGTPITGDALARASQAALALTGGGTVTQTEVGDEESFYQVEVTLADGRQTDVNLDAQFQVVGNKTEPAGADVEPDSGN